MSLKHEKTVLDILDGVAKNVADTTDDDGLEPALFYLDKDGMVLSVNLLVGFGGFSPSDKSAVQKQFRERFAPPKAEAAVFVTEAWTLAQSPDKPLPNVSLAAHDDRISAIVVTYQDKGAATLLGMAEIKDRKFDQGELLALLEEPDQTFSGVLAEGWV